MTTTITGYAAIDYAEEHGLLLSKYADPTEEAREGLTPDEARWIAREDPSLIYLTIRPRSARKIVEEARRAARSAGHVHRYCAAADVLRAAHHGVGAIPHASHEGPERRPDADWVACACDGCRLAAETAARLLTCGALR